MEEVYLCELATLKLNSKLSNLRCKSRPAIHTINTPHLSHLSVFILLQSPNPELFENEGLRPLTLASTGKGFRVNSLPSFPYGFRV